MIRVVYFLQKAALTTAKRKFWRPALSLLLSAEMSLSPVLAFAHEAKPGEPGGQPGAHLSSPPTDFTKFADSLDRGEIPSAVNQDIWGLRGQFVEVYEGQPQPVYSYPLDRPQTDRTRLGFTQLRPYFDNEKGCLAIEATRGANDQGANGTLVARQYFPAVRDVAAMALDSEILSIIDHSGNLHQMDWGSIEVQAFRSVMQVQFNVWTPAAPMDLSRSKVEAAYLTIGHEPIDPNRDVMENAVLPLNRKGEFEAHAGDLHVKIDGKTLGIFTRDVSHQNMERGQTYLFLGASLLAQDSDNVKSIAEMLDDAETQHAEFESDMKRVQDTFTDPMVALAMRSISPDRLAEVKNRIMDQRRYQKRDRDFFTLEEWKQEFEKIEANARKENPDVTPEQIAQNWQRYVPRRFAQPAEPPSLVRDYLIEKRGWTPERAERWRERISLSVKLAAAGGAIAAAMGAPAIYEHSQALQQIGVLNWIYAHYPSVLKDAAYRWPLIASSLSLTAFWPAGVVTSWTAGRALSFLSARVQNSDSKIAGKIRDLARGWSPLSNWQRITSFGMRFYSEIVLAPYIHMVETFGRQKTLITSLTYNLNPFTKVEKDSPLGRQVGLEEDSRIGFVTPGYGTAYEHKLDQKRAMIAELAKQKHRLKEHTWLLAALAVSERYGVDLATLLSAQSGPAAPRLEDLQHILKDPKARQEWELLADELNRSISSLPLDLNNAGAEVVDAAELARQYELAKETAEKLAKLDRSRVFLRQLSLLAKRRGAAFKNLVLNIGRDQYTFLKTVFTNKFVYEQVEREFVSDHLIMVYLIALAGERADLSHPENLAAMADGFMWTSPQHLQDMSLNTYLHFFLAGSRLALVYQQLSGKEETNYTPREDIANQMPIETTPGLFSRLSAKLHDRVRATLGLSPRKARGEGLVSPAHEQSFTGGLWTFTKGLTLPWKADMGGLMIRRLNRSAQTIFAYITMTLLTRMTAGGQSFHDAAYGLVISWLAAQWYFGWVWDPAQQGNLLYANRYEELRGRMIEARRKIEWGLRQTDEQKAEALLQEGVDQMRGIYEEMKPKALAGIDPNQALDFLARHYLDLADKEAPGPMAPNSKIAWLSSTAAALSSTMMGISLTIFTFDQGALNIGTVGDWAMISAGLYAVCWAFLGKYTYDNWWGFKHVKQAVDGAIENSRQKRVERLRTQYQAKAPPAGAAGCGRLLDDGESKTGTDGP